jgi:ketosteroid isomerase-like protein
MSAENVEAFMRGIDAFNRGDVEAVLEELDAEVEWHPVFQVVMLGGVAAVYRGHEGVRDELREWYETLGEVQVAISETRDLGERIVAIGRVRARGQESGAPVEFPGAWVVEYKNRKAVRVREYLDPKEAREAAGLRG